MQVKHGSRVELDLNDKQVTLARKHCGAGRWAYNYGLRRKIEAYQQGQKTPYAADLHREINAVTYLPIQWGGFYTLTDVGCVPTVKCLWQHCGLYPVHNHNHTSANAR